MLISSLPFVVFRSFGTDPQSLPKRVLHGLWSSTFSFDIQYPVFSLKSFGSCLPLLPHLLVTSILPSTFSAVPCFRRQFLRNMTPIQLSFLNFEEISGLSSKPSLQKFKPCEIPTVSHSSTIPLLGYLNQWTKWNKASNPAAGGGRFSAPVQTDLGGHSAFYTMGTGSFLGV